MQSCPVRSWDTATADRILIEGERTYLNALESHNISDAETRKASSSRQSSIEATIIKWPIEANKDISNCCHLS